VADVVWSPLQNSDDVIGKVQEVYERLSPEVQAELPLRRVWTLGTEDS
jgi:predicted Mrr-cat superfamily restriction endonuclease